MSLIRYAKRRDENEPEIIEYFERRGFSVYRLDQPMDLLLGKHGKNWLIEVKMPKKGKLTEKQGEFIEVWRGQYEIISSIKLAAKWADTVEFGVKQ